MPLERNKSGSGNGVPRRVRILALLALTFSLISAVSLSTGIVFYLSILVISLAFVPSTPGMQLAFLCLLYFLAFAFFSLPLFWELSSLTGLRYAATKNKVWMAKHFSSIYPGVIMVSEGFLETYLLLNRKFPTEQVVVFINPSLPPYVTSWLGPFWTYFGAIPSVGVGLILIACSISLKTLGQHSTSAKVLKERSDRPNFDISSHWVSNSPKSRDPTFSKIEGVH